MAASMAGTSALQIRLVQQGYVSAALSASSEVTLSISRKAFAELLCTGSSSVEVGLEGNAWSVVTIF